VEVENDEEAVLVSSFSLPLMGVVVASRVLTFVIDGLYFLMMLRNFSENPLFLEVLFLTGKGI
jgi:hypothetical protein